MTLKALQILARIKLGLLKETISGEFFGTHIAQEKIGLNWTITMSVDKISPVKGQKGEFMIILLNKCTLNK